MLVKVHISLTDKISVKLPIRQLGGLFLFCFLTLLPTLNLHFFKKRMSS